MSYHAPQLDLERLRALRTTGLLCSPAPVEFEEICRRAQEQFQVPIALVTLVCEDMVMVKARVGTNLEGVPRLHQFCDHAISGDEVLVVPDAPKDRRFAMNPLVAGEPFLRFYAGAPLAYVRGIRLGSLCLLDTRPRDFSPEDRAELERMADEVVSAIVEREFERVSGPVIH